MKVAFECIQCKNDWINDKSNYQRSLYIKEVTNSHETFTFECPKGHYSTYEITSPQYEILYSIACFAIIDGYYRESIASFNACLEMFYDFTIRVILDNKKINTKDINDLFNNIKLSERRFGAFASIWLLTENQPYTNIKSNYRDDMTKLRNNVIHNGTIPTKEETLKFGDYVCNIIKPLINTLKEKYSQSIKNINFPNESKEIDGHVFIFSPLKTMIRDNKTLKEAFKIIEMGYEIHGYKNTQPNTFLLK